MRAIGRSPTVILCQAQVKPQRRNDYSPRAMLPNPPTRLFSTTADLPPPALAPPNVETAAPLEPPNHPPTHRVSISPTCLFPPPTGPDTTYDRRRPSQCPCRLFMACQTLSTDPVLTGVGPYSSAGLHLGSCRVPSRWYRSSRKLFLRYALRPRGVRDFGTECEYEARRIGAAMCPILVRNRPPQYQTSVGLPRQVSN